MNEAKRWLDGDLTGKMVQTHEGNFIGEVRRDDSSTFQTERRLMSFGPIIYRKILVKSCIEKIEKNVITLKPFKNDLCNSQSDVNNLSDVPNFLI